MKKEDFLNRSRFRDVALLALVLGWAMLAPTRYAAAEPPKPTVQPQVRAVDVQLGQTQEVCLADGKRVTVRLLDVQLTRDSLVHAVREARVQVEVNGQKAWLGSGNYNLPQTVAGVQVDCPVTKGFDNSDVDSWGLVGDARLRLWPGGSPLMNPPMVYPLKQRWLATATQMDNEPVFLCSSQQLKKPKIYYHNGLDFGGCEGQIEVVSAVDGQVIAAQNKQLPGYDDPGWHVRPRPDEVYVIDAQGWCYCYAHLYSVEHSIQVGTRVRAGQRLGLLGKEGTSGGWAHLHFDIFRRQPSGKLGCELAYAYAWEAYRRQHQPQLIAVARPHHVAWTGEPVALDGSRSWSAAGKIARYDWTFSDGGKAQGERIERTYGQPGYFCETLKVTDAAGRSGYDFVIVHVHDRQHPEQFPARLHATYAPTFGIKPGDQVTFKVRCFGNSDGEEVWDFGDKSATQRTRSHANVKNDAAEKHAPDGYAVVTHRYAQPGHYLVSVERTDRWGHRSLDRLQVHVGD